MYVLLIDNEENVVDAQDKLGDGGGSLLFDLSSSKDIESWLSVINLSFSSSSKSPFSSEIGGNAGGNLSFKFDFFADGTRALLLNYE